MNTLALGVNGHTIWLVGASCLLIGIIGKSGQFPLHTWLPDAMAGPTPVSALIHAATMVVAGVYLGARVYGVFWQGFSIADGGINPMAAIGAITILIGAALAFVQDDIKKVLAYSTISQLGYMVMGLGVGAWVGAVFHLFTHAFFKALLFLGAGSVSHSGSHHSFDMKKDMGGLRKFMPITFWTFMIGSLALAGVFPLAGFWSKDEILATAGQGGYEVFMVVGLVGAFLTAAYMTRCVWLTFFGEYRGHHHPHESPKAITGPLVVLAGFSIVAGLANASAFGIEKFKEYVEPHGGVPPGPPARLRHRPRRDLVRDRGRRHRGRPVLLARPQGAPRSQGPHRTLGRGQDRARVPRQQVLPGPPVRGRHRRRHQGPDRPRVVLGEHQRDRCGRQGCRSRLDRVGRLTYRYIDRDVVDGAVNAIGRETDPAGGLLRPLQSGRLQRYALFLFASVA